MIRRLLAAPVLWVWLLLPAAGMDAASINNAEFAPSKPPAEGKADALVIKAQVLLDRAPPLLVRHVLQRDILGRPDPGVANEDVEPIELPLGALEQRRGSAE